MHNMISTLEKIVIDMLNESGIEESHIDPNKDLWEYGMNSLSFVRYIVEIEEAYTIEIPPDDFLYENFRTLETTSITLKKLIENE